MEIRAIATGIEKYKSIIKKKKKEKYDKIVLLAKPKSNTINVLICNALIDSNTGNEELLLINNVLKEYGDMKEEIKHLKT